MPKFTVTVLITNAPKEKEITVWAADELAAEDKACEIVSSWDGVDDVEATDVEEVEA